MLVRKNILVLVLVIISLPSFGQFTLGLKFSPTLSTNRIEDSSDSLAITTNGTGIRMAVGPIADIEIRENYFISTGLLLVSKRAGIEAVDENTGSVRKETYGLQYLQVPLTLKLFTNEVALDKKIYFQVGATTEFLVNEKAKDSDNRYVPDFFIFDSSLLIGMGLEYRVGLNTVLFGGFSYQRGLVNSIKDENVPGGDLNLKNDYISLDLGIKF